MANVAAVAAAAAANRDPAVDRSLRSVFGKIVAFIFPFTGRIKHYMHDKAIEEIDCELKLAKIDSRVISLARQQT